MGPALLSATVGLLTALTAPAPGPVAWYRFDDAPALGRDASGEGADAQVVGAAAGAGRVGGGLALDGQGGLELRDPARLTTSGGFAVDLWVKLGSVALNHNVVSRDGEFMLRLDPPNEGSRLSFFVNAGDKLEPRVRGPVVKPDTWYHVIATWDGVTASLWVNGQLQRASRPGALAASGQPLLVGGPQQWAPAGLVGVVDEVKLFSRALTDREVLVSEFGLDQPGAGPAVTAARFEFDRDAAGWETRYAPPPTVRDGRLVLNLAESGAVALRRGLRVPLADQPFVALGVTTAQPTGLRVAYVTTTGAGALTLDLIGDGRPHTYVLRAEEDTDWAGELLGLALAPVETGASLDLDFLRVAATAAAPCEIAVRHFLPVSPLNRAGRPCRVFARLHNRGGTAGAVTAALAAEGARIEGEAVQTLAPFAFDETREVTWTLRADAAAAARLALTVTAGEAPPLTAALDLAITPAVDLPRATYVPAPQAVESKVLVGAHYCPLWKQSARSGVWELIAPYPEREPVLGFYDEDNPEVTDWEIKQALEHGISYFVYCWYRRNQGQPVQQALGHAIHDGLFKARYRDQFKFTIMWENQQRGVAGVASEQDFLENLLPYWIETYFKHPSYLKIDGQPLLFIYRPEFLVGDLGSAANVRSALDKARAACRAAGFQGLTILGEYRGTDPRPLRLMSELGLDYSFAYCWPVNGNPAPEAAIQAQESYWESWRQQNVIPHLLTVSMGWDSRPWHPSSSIWRLPPADFAELCRRSLTAMSKLPATSLGRRTVLLDNWNEFGEGHYLAPHREYGYGYLDAVRSAYTEAPAEHLDLAPEEIGLGPYETGYRTWLQQADGGRDEVKAPGAEPSLVGWWTFDEPADSRFALDWSGHRAGGPIDQAQRVPGHRGQALDCRGGAVTVRPEALRYRTDRLTVEAWIRTDLAGQSNKWFLNNVYSGGQSGFRMGLTNGRVCWHLPQAPWSHNLVAGVDLPLGQWVHVAATYDGETMRLYQNGREVGQMRRGGRFGRANRHLCLGNYDRGHAAFFRGQLDEVKLWDRVLTADEIARSAR